MKGRGLRVGGQAPRQSQDRGARGLGAEGRPGCGRGKGRRRGRSECSRGARGGGLAGGVGGPGRPGGMGDHRSPGQTSASARQPARRFGCQGIRPPGAGETGAGKGGSATLRCYRGDREAEGGARGWAAGSGGVAGLTSRGGPSGLVGPAGPEEAGMDSGPRGLPGARFQGNGARTVERQAAPPLARAAEEQEVAGGAEVASRTSGGRGRGSGVSFLGSLRMAWKVREKGQFPQAGRA